jgi:hypothetical protein
VNSRSDATERPSPVAGRQRGGENENCFVRSGDWRGDADRLRPVRGAIDLTGLEFVFSISGPVGRLSPNDGELVIGSGVEGFYGGPVSGSANFGSGGQTLSSSNTGGPVEISPRSFLGVPSGYVSDSPLSETSTYLSQTFSSLGVTPGTYKWTWGSGANQNFTLVVESAVPEPSTWAMLLLGFAGLGYAGYRKTRCDNALA